MFSFVQFELLNRASYSAIINVKRIEPEVEPEATSMQAQPLHAATYFTYLASGTVRQ